MSWIRCSDGIPGSGGTFSIRLHNEGKKAPTATNVFQTEEFSGSEHGNDFYLSDGMSLLHLRYAHADAYLAPSFFTKPELLQRKFWSFGLLKLLGSTGYYSLHAAGLSSPEGRGLLVIGPSGSGKSTLALGLIRNGWSYLSDDAILLHVRSGTVSALALRKHFYINANAASMHNDLPHSDDVTDKTGGRKRRVHLETAYPGRRIPECKPEILLFSRIISDESSVLCPVDSSTALKHLLDASGPQLLDRQRIRPHLDTLKNVLHQAVVWELHAGRDLYRNPTKLTHLLGETIGEKQWRALSSN
jgi:hypothetical protein